MLCLPLEVQVAEKGCGEESWGVLLEEWGGPWASCVTEHFKSAVHLSKFVILPVQQPLEQCHRPFGHTPVKASCGAAVSWEGFTCSNSFTRASAAAHLWLFL